MADDFRLDISAGLSKASLDNVLNELKDVTSKKYKIEFVGDNKQVRTAVSEMKDSMGNLFKVTEKQLKNEANEWTTVSRKIKDVAKSTDTLTTLTQKYHDSQGNLVTEIKRINQAGEQVGETQRKILDKSQLQSEAISQNLGDILIKVAKFYGIVTLINKVVDGIVESFQEIARIDLSKTEFSKVSDFNTEEIDVYLDRLGELGKTVGRTAREMLDASTQFKKSGFDESDSAQLSKVSGLFQNIADDQISSAQASELLVSQIKAFNLTADDAIKVINAINKVSNKFAVSSSDLSKSIPKVSATLSQMGNTMEETIALITAGSEIMIGQSSKVARGLRNISINFNAQNKSARELSSIWKENGLSLRGLDGQMKSTFTILEELNTKWDTLNKSTQNQIAILASGKHNVDVFNAVMSNFGTAIKANKSAIESSNSAIKENEKYMGSLEAKTKQAEASFSNFANKTISVDFLKALQEVKAELFDFGASGIGQVTVQTIGWTVAVTSLVAIFPKIIDGLAKIKTLIVSTEVASIGLSTAIPIIAGVVLAVSSVNAIYKELHKTTEELEGITETLTQKQIELKKELEKPDDVEKSILTRAELAKVTLELAEAEAKLDKAREKETAKKLSDFGFSNINLMKSSIRGVKQAQENLESLNSFQTSTLAENKISILEWRDSLQSLVDQGVDLNDYQREFLEYLNETADEIINVTLNTSNYSRELETVSELQDKFSKSIEGSQIGLSLQNDEIGETLSLLESLSSIQAKVANGQSLSYTETKKLLEINPNFIKSIKATENGYILEKEALTDLIDETLRSEKEAVSAEIEKTQKVLDSIRTRTEAYVIEQSVIQGLAKDREKAVVGTTNLDQAEAKRYKNILNETAGYQDLVKQLDDLIERQKLLDVGFSPTESDTISSQLDSVQKLTSEHDKVIQRLEHELFLMQKQGASQDELIDKIQEIQNELHNFAEVERTEDEVGNQQHIDALQKQWWKYSDEIKKILENLTKEQISNQNKVIDDLKISLSALDKVASDNQSQLQDRLKSLTELFDAQVQAMQLYAEAQSDEYDRAIDGLEAEKSRLQDVNKERQDAIDKEKALQNLAKANQELNAIYREGQGFVYGTDAESIAKAQDKLNELEEKQRHEDNISRIDERIEYLQREKDKWSDYVDDYSKNLNRLLIEEKLGTSLEEFYRQNNVRGFESFTNAYNKIQQGKLKEQIDATQEQIDSWGELTSEIDTKQNEINDAIKNGFDYQEKVNAWKLADMESFKGEYLRILDELKQAEQTKQQLQSSLSSGSNMTSSSSSSNSGELARKLKEMQDNSASWWDENKSPSEKIALHKRNQQLAKEIESLTKYKPSFNSGSGKWDVLRYGSGVNKIKDDQMAIVGENPYQEIVLGSKLNSGQMMNLPKGSGVINSQATRTLAGLANSLSNLPSAFNRTTTTSSGQSIIIQNLNLPQVKNGQDLVNYFRNNFNNDVLQSQGV